MPATVLGGRQPSSGYLHTPVLVAEVVQQLNLKTGGRYLDATIGGAGHAVAILERIGPTGALLGIDCDPGAVAASRERLAPYPRATVVQGAFDQLADAAQTHGWPRVDGVLFDLGFSSAQVDDSRRGMSFASDVLDLRMDPDVGSSAADLLRQRSAEELADIFRRYGEEPLHRPIAQAIVRQRRTAPISSGRALAELVAGVYRRYYHGRSRREPAMRVFQALRITVNDELGQLERALPQAAALLNPGGRLAVISFHSLEDRIVKMFIRRESRDCTCPPSVPVCVCTHRASLKPITRTPLTPTVAEVAANPRSRSAKLRVAEKLPPASDPTPTPNL